MPELNIKPKHASDIPASDYGVCLKLRVGTHCLNHILHSVHERIMVNKDDITWTIAYIMEVWSFFDMFDIQGRVKLVLEIIIG